MKSYLLVLLNFRFFIYLFILFIFQILPSVGIKVIQLFNLFYFFVKLCLYLYIYNVGFLQHPNQGRGVISNDQIRRFKLIMIISFIFLLGSVGSIFL